MTPGTLDNLFTPGYLANLLAAACGLFAFVAAIRWSRGRAESELTFRYTYHGMTLALVMGTIFLMIAILTHDFRYSYVVGYSSRDLPLLYLVSAFWGGQEGTFLLWALLGALIGYPLFRRTSWEPATVMACYLPTVLFQIGLMLDRGGNPFNLMPQVPADGRGLNPLLQDPWMASHPPVVFLGYAAMTVPAALALAALLKREEQRWVDTSLRWSLIGFISLGMGIILGGFWAYKVLGWGGYWGWDPVENASLVPWIVVTALVHGLLVQKGTGALRRSNLIMALSGYLLVVYATFLTRSGVLADFSVHSFPKGTLFRWLILGMLVIIVAGAYALIRRREPPGRAIDFNAGWPFLISMAVVLLAMSSALVLIGTSWPIISGLFGQPVLPKGPFYNQVSLPVYVGLLLLLGVAPFSMWKATSWTHWNRKVWISLGLALLAALAAVAGGGRGAQYVLLFASAAFALASNLIRLYLVARVRMLNTGAALGHLGFALMIIGIVCSSAWDRESDVRLPLGQPVEALGRTLTYHGRVEGSEPEDQWSIGVSRPGGTERIARTAMYQTGGGGGSEPQVMRKPAILRSLGHDLYLAPLGLESGETVIDMHKDEPIVLDGVRLTFLAFETGAAEKGRSMTVRALVRIERDGGEAETVFLDMESDGADMQTRPVMSATLPGATLSLMRIGVEQQLIQVEVRREGMAQTLVVAASVKPMMNVLWAGTLVMTFGCGVAATRRYLDKRALLAAQEGAAPTPAAAPGGATTGSAARPPRETKTAARMR